MPRSQNVAFLLFGLAVLPLASMSDRGSAAASTSCDGGTPATVSASLLQLATRRSSLGLRSSLKAVSQSATTATNALHAVVAHRQSVSNARHAVFAGGLHRAMAELQKSRNVSNTELDNLISRFIDHHAADEDKCPARLMEAKHQLNDLHKAIQDLADLINTTESDVHIIARDLDDVLEKIKDIEKDKTKDKDRNSDEKNDNTKMLATLREEMEEMRQIAQPGVTMAIPNRTIKAKGGALSLLQLAGAAGQSGQDGQQVDEVQNMVLQTKDVASAMMSCFLQLRQQRDEAQQQLLLMQGSTPALEAVSAPAENQSVGTLIAVNSILEGASGTRNCSVNTTVDVEVGKKRSKVTFGRAVANGTSGYYHCSKVNTDFGGVLMLHCNDGVLTADARGCFRFADEKKCLEQKQQLEDTYVKAYVELARLIKEYEDLTSPDEDGDVEVELENEKEEPLQDKADKLAADQGEKLRQLEDLRPRLEDMILAERKLREHIKKLSEECQQLPDTESGLQRVREAIRALEACPGLGRAQFHIPLWSGEWVQITLDNKKTDASNDAVALQACVTKFGKGKSIRVAEVSEIQAHSVEGMPLNNTAPVALLGACPHCEGADDDATGKTNREGHSRLCWDPDMKLDQASRRKDCSLGSKAVMCVYDRGDIRKSKFPFTTPEPTTTSTTGRSLSLSGGSVVDDPEMIESASVAEDPERSE